MQTVSIEIINKKALKLLKDLEQLQLIRFKKENLEMKPKKNWQAYKGSMKKQPIGKVEKQLNDIRNDWE